MNPHPNTNPDPAFQVNPDPIRTRSQDFDDQKLKKKIQLNFFLNKKLQLTYLKASIKDVQATGEASALKREHPALQKIKCINFYFSGHFFPPGSGTGCESGSRIQNTAFRIGF
jgi:hypothetical protein